MRHGQLDGAGALHLLAADPGNLLHHPQAERQVGVEAAPELADKPRPDEQLVRRDLGVGRALLERGDEIARPEYHGGRTAKKVAAPMATRENVCCQLAASDLAYPPSCPQTARCANHGP